MFKKLAVSLPLAIAVLGSSAVMAANDASTIINIRADIPTKQFHAQPLDPNFGRDEVMTYNTVTEELSQLSAVFTLKNNAGSIDAYLQDGPASLTNGVEAIPLTITLGDVELTGTPKPVAGELESDPGMQKTMVIKADKPTAAQTGRFNTVTTVIFDNVPKALTN